jgi:hypothetical protein
MVIFHSYVNVYQMVSVNPMRIPGFTAGWLHLGPSKKNPRVDD